MTKKKKKREPLPVSIVERVKGYPYVKSALFKLKQLALVAAILACIALYLALQGR